MKNQLNHWLLVNYAGYPYTPSSLMPDNGLANLAGALIRDGRAVHILDYATIDTIRRMTTPPLQHRLSREWEALRRTGSGPLSTARRILALPMLHHAEAVRRRARQKLVEEIGNHLCDHVSRNGIEAVGFKLWNGDGLEGSVRLAAILRNRHPKLRIFGGGPHVDLFMGRLLDRYPVFHALACGDGEHTITMLAHHGASDTALGDIPNLIFRDAAGTIRFTAEEPIENLDDLPMPVYDPAVYPAMAGNEKIKIIVIDESRGCQNNCAFCIHPVKSHSTVRTKSIGRLVHEVQLLVKEYNVHAFRFAGSCTPYFLLNEFSREIINKSLKIQYSSFAHIHHGDEADFDLIRKSGCVSLFFGIESGSQRVLDRLAKRNTPSSITMTLRRARDAGLFTVGSFIFPAPGDTDETMAETLELVRDLRLGSITLQPPIVIPRTRWFENPDAYGFGIVDREKYLDVGMTWKVKIQLPPKFWDPLPITLDGLSHRKTLERTATFSRHLDRLGIPTSISDDNYLMSQRIGIDPVAFKNQSLAAFFAGNADAVQTLASAVNQAEP